LSRISPTRYQRASGNEYGITTLTAKVNTRLERSKITSVSVPTVDPRLTHRWMHIENFYNYYDGRHDSLD
jgi:hypothetical protein